MKHPRVPPGARLGPYEIVGLLGVGGMGEVYRARDPRLGRDVAIKILPADVSTDPDRQHRFQQEARAGGMLNHPNIMAVYDVGTYGASPYIVSELLEGETLRARLAGGPEMNAGASPRLSIGEAVGYARQIAEGLSVAHGRGVVHRDLKPDNLFVTPDGRVKILDFGLAKLLPTGNLLESAATQTVSGFIVGTVGYMAPEQVRGQPADQRADIFALGAVVYEMLTGRRAFVGVSASDTLSAILRDEPPAIAATNPAVSDGLESIVRRCLEKKPEARFQSARELSLALAEILTPTSQHLARPATVDRALHRRMLLGVAAIALTIVGGIAVWFGRDGSVPSVETASILALPTQVYGTPEYGYLADAVPATLSTHLAQIAGLETKVPPTKLEFEPLRGDLSRVADIYQVQAVVLSSVTAEGDHLVLNIQLVEPGTRRVRWSQQYEGQRDRYVPLVRQAADGLRLALRPNAAPMDTTPALSGNSIAELALRSGQHYADRYNNRHEAGDLDLAQSELTRALQLDPTLAEAAAEIAYLHLYRQNAGVPAEQAIPEADRWARRALQIDERTAKAWAALVWVESWQPDASPRKLVDFGMKAARFGPRCAACQTSFGQALSSASVSLSVAAGFESLRLDPLFVISKINVAASLMYLGQTAEALSLIDQALTLEPDSPLALQEKALILVDQGRSKDAGLLLGRLREYVDHQRLPVLFFMIPQHAVLRGLGNAGEADIVLAKLMREYVEIPSATTGDLLFVQQELVPVLASHGKISSALDILVRTSRKGAVPPYDWLRLNRHLQVMQDDPRFRDVAEKSKAQFDQMQEILASAKSRKEMPDYLEQPLRNLAVRILAK